MASSAGVDVTSSAGVGVGVSVSQILPEAVDEALEELEAFDESQAASADATKAVARMKVTIFFFKGNLLCKVYFVCRI